MKDTPRRAVSILESHLAPPAPAWLNNQMIYAYPTFHRGVEDALRTVT